MSVDCLESLTVTRKSFYVENTANTWKVRNDATCNILTANYLVNDFITP